MPLPAPSSRRRLAFLRALSGLFLALAALHATPPAARAGNVQVASTTVNGNPIDLFALTSLVGGSFSGPGVANNIFTPSAVGIGTFTITFTGAGTTTLNIAVLEEPSAVVTTTQDAVNPSDGLTSLREAVNFANGFPVDFIVTIGFGDGSAVANGVNFTDGNPHKIQLTQGPITLGRRLRITGEGATKTLIDGGWNGVVGSQTGRQIFLITAAR